MFELRILNGLHRGATLPLDERPLVIGASEDADVVLVDPGIETQHATLTLTAQGWSLSTLDGAVLGAEHNRPFTSLDLQAGDFARLGHVWLTVADAEAPWENPPPEPAQNDTSDDYAADDDTATDDNDNDIAADAENPDGHAELGANTGVEDDELYSDSPLDAQLNAEAEAAVADVQPTPASKVKAASRFGGRRSKMARVPLALVTILSACAAFTITSGPDNEPSSKTSAMLDASSLASLPPGTAPGSPRSAEALKPSPQISQHELREAFRKRLQDVALLKRFDLKLKDNAWTMQAALDDDEAARFERVLTSFIHTHNIEFPVHAKIGSAEAMLPFRIRQVVSGSNASVITHDGNRLYIGDEYRGVRLVAIDGSHLKFDGDRKIKVKW